LGLLALVAAAAEPFGVTARLERAGTGALLSVAFAVQEGHYLYAEQIAVEAPPGVDLKPEALPAAKLHPDPFSQTTTAVYDRNVTLGYRLNGPVPAALEIVVRYRGCSASQCFLPQTKTLAVTLDGTAPAPARESPPPGPAPEADDSVWSSRLSAFTLTGRAEGYLAARRFLEFLNRAETEQERAGDRLADAFREKGLWFVLAIVILGGLLLNLTPCVLPMIPVNLAIIGAGVEGGSRRRGLALGAAYGAGIALAYGALGAAVVLMGARFGTLNASPWFNLAVAAVFLVLALGMFGVFNLDFTRFRRGAGAADSPRSGALVTACVMGGVAALLAGACVAPVVISVLLLAASLFAAGSPAGLLLPFALGIGMALPWPLAGVGLTFLPRPGKWMNIVKAGLGAIILAAALWYGRLGYRLLRDRGEAGKAAVAAAQAEAVREGWLVALDDALRQAQREGRPVLIDFWASWCKNCLRMEQTTFRDRDVRRRLAPYVKVKFRAEDPSAPEIRQVLDRFQVVGLPTYVILRPARGASRAGGGGGPAGRQRERRRDGRG